MIVDLAAPQFKFTLKVRLYKTLCLSVLELQYCASQLAPKDLTYIICI